MPSASSVVGFGHIGHKATRARRTRVCVCVSMRPKPVQYASMAVYMFQLANTRSTCARVCVCVRCAVHTLRVQLRNKLVVVVAG